MEKTKKKGLLVVSFGTSVHKTREKTIDAIEQALQEAFGEFTCYRAWTSKFIIRKLRERDQIQIDTVTEAMERMFKDGVTDVLVQPTHVLNGIENEQMIAEVSACQGWFRSVCIGTPLLAGEEDVADVAEAVAEEFSWLPQEEALVLMGHGTSHEANEIYAALDHCLKRMGHDNMFLGTVEASPSLLNLMERVQAYGAKKVTLAPFIVVAGEHALHDLSGEGADSWKSQLEDSGYQVRCVLKGLGEYPKIRRLYVKHAEGALRIC